MSIILTNFSIGLVIAFAHSLRPRTSTAIAIITEPEGSQRVEGIVNIVGTATHPVFNHYELHFALDPNPAATWFPIVLAGARRVENAQLGQWDTDSISTGTYMLRLRVFSSDGSMPTEIIIPGIAVRAIPDPATPTPAPTMSTTITPPLVTTIVHPAAYQLGNLSSPSRFLLEQLRAKHDYRSIFIRSTAYSIVTFLCLGLYLQLRKLVRPHVRRMLRRVRSDLRKP